MQLVCIKVNVIKFRYIVRSNMDYHIIALFIYQHCSVDYRFHHWKIILKFFLAYSVKVGATYSIRFFFSLDQMSPT